MLFSVTWSPSVSLRQFHSLTPFLVVPNTLPRGNGTGQRQQPRHTLLPNVVDKPSMPKVVHLSLVASDQAVDAPQPRSAVSWVVSNPWLCSQSQPPRITQERSELEKAPFKLFAEQPAPFFLHMAPTSPVRLHGMPRQDE
jgi:hypothetical protein